MKREILEELIEDRTAKALRKEYESLITSAQRRPHDMKLSDALSDEDSGYDEFCWIARAKGYELGAQWKLADVKFVDGAMYVDANSLSFAVRETITLPFKKKNCQREVVNRRCEAFGVALSLRGWSLLFDIPLCVLDDALAEGRELEKIIGTMNSGTLVFNGEEMLETQALNSAGVRRSWFSKRKHDEEKLLGRSMRQDEKQKLFERLVAEGKEFRESGFLEMFGVGWLRVDNDDLRKLQSAAAAKGVSVGSYLHDLINESK